MIPGFDAAAYGRRESGRQPQEFGRLYWSLLRALQNGPVVARWRTTPRARAEALKGSDGSEALVSELGEITIKDGLGELDEGPLSGAASSTGNGRNGRRAASRRVSVRSGAVW
jgi:hypothetical protein